MVTIQVGNKQYQIDKHKNLEDLIKEHISGAQYMMLARVAMSFLSSIDLLKKYEY